jgi:acetyl-CoA carboxylase biotin carboxyl carrier protein
MRPRLEVLVEHGVAGELLLLSPAVGLYGEAPRQGEVLVAGSRVGRLSILGRSVDLALGAGTTGRVAERGTANHRDPVAYGQVLLRLVPVAAAEVGGEGAQGSDEGARGLPDGSFAVLSPTHGMFYRRSRPDAPAYVEVGQVVAEGATLALVEVMKCFSAITYGGVGLPSRAEVVDIRADDGAEVHAEQVLFVVKPA